MPTARRKETLKGYIYKPATGTPVLVYARPFPGITMGLTVREDGPALDLVAVKAAVATRAPGLYQARVVLDAGLAGTLTVTARARPVEVGAEVRRLVALAARPKRRKGTKARRPATTPRMHAIRAARALVDALRREVLPLTNPTPARPAEVTP